MTNKISNKVEIVIFNSHVSFELQEAACIGYFFSKRKVSRTKKVQHSNEKVMRGSM